MSSQEITADALDVGRFIQTSLDELASVVGNDSAVCALSGGIDSSVVAYLGHRALGKRARICFIDTGLMREGEPEAVAGAFMVLGIPVERIDAHEEFLYALRGLTDPEAKREAITQAFYRDVFGPLFKRLKARFLLQGTNLTDIEEAVAPIKRQHNVLAQLGIDPEKEYGYRVLEPLMRLRKPAVRKVAQALGLPAAIVDRRPFPGPALATRIIGEVTPELLWVVRKATRIVEEELSGVDAFQIMAIVHSDKVTGVRGGRRELGYQIEVRCWDSADAVTATPTELPFSVLRKLGQRLTTELVNVVSVTYNIVSKPPSTMEAV
jgi:GMP synthase (glutamine-hydrolysing)